jgi:hypothetical protein
MASEGFRHAAGTSDLNFNIVSSEPHDRDPKSAQLLSCPGICSYEVKIWLAVSSRLMTELLGVLKSECLITTLLMCYRRI